MANTDFVTLAIDVDVTLTPSKQTIFYGDQLQLNCSVKGDASAKITWSFPYQRSFMADNIAIQDGILTVTDVRQENGGVYR